MGIFRRPESRFWWIYLEPTKRKIATKIPIGHGGTRAERAAFKRTAQTLYFALMLEFVDLDADRVLARAIDLLERRVSGETPAVPRLP